MTIKLEYGKRYITKYGGHITAPLMRTRDVAPDNHYALSHPFWDSARRRSFTAEGRFDDHSDVVSSYDLVEEYVEPAAIAQSPTAIRGESAFAVQVGGAHYKAMSIQPAEFIHKNGIGFLEGNVIKYVCRYKQKNGADDLKKARHYIDMLIELQGAT